jgi:hypothetical protein
VATKLIGLLSPYKSDAFSLHISMYVHAELPQALEQLIKYMFRNIPSILTSGFVLELECNEIFVNHWKDVYIF